MVSTKRIEELLNEGSASLELRPILAPSRQLAQLVAGFSNTEAGYIVFGAKKKLKHGYEIMGLTSDFNVSAITSKALDLLVPRPHVDYGFHNLGGRQVFIIAVHSSPVQILLEGKKYIRNAGKTMDADEQLFTFNTAGQPKFIELNNRLTSYKAIMTDAKSRVIAHYQGALKIMDNLAMLLYPNGLNKPTDSYEGKILTRILFSSVVDNFEIYLSDLLYEIWLANPNTLKGPATVTLEQVLNCSDIEDFIKFYAKDKISKMKKGSVKTFIKDNKLISDLNVFNPAHINDVESILQIRHLYAHSNGIIDEHFLKSYRGSLTVGDDYLLSTEDVLMKLNYLSGLANMVDIAAITKYNLSTL
ncbi:AlbA family DNA-binding domain-containing protein [Sphingobacterium sp. MYb382]|uniref:AlbA family DNA-binding domain-containing protein n=1 Tax=Sphingobacterium sp. MYb382 TaxID=2745278 RepID=UPI0030A7CA3E